MQNTELHKQVHELSNNSGLFPFLQRKIDTRKSKHSRSKVYYTFNTPVVFSEQQMIPLLWEIKSLSKNILEVSYKLHAHNTKVTITVRLNKLPGNLKTRTSGKLTSEPQILSSQNSLKKLIVGDKFYFEDLSFSVVGSKVRVLSLTSTVRLQSLLDESVICGLPAKLFQNKNLYKI